MSKPIKILKLTRHKKLARMFHMGNDYYEIVVNKKDENGEVVCKKIIVADCTRHAKTQFTLWINHEFPTRRIIMVRNQDVKVGHIPY